MSKVAPLAKEVTTEKRYLYKNAKFGVQGPFGTCRALGLNAEECIKKLSVTYPKEYIDISGACSIDPKGTSHNRTFTILFNPLVKLVGKKGKYKGKKGYFPAYWDKMRTTIHIKIPRGRKKAKRKKVKMTKKINYYWKKGNKIDEWDEKTEKYTVKRARKLWGKVVLQGSRRKGKGEYSISQACVIKFEKKKKRGIEQLLDLLFPVPKIFR